jgi:hypothetical protein
LQYGDGFSGACLGASILLAGVGLAARWGTASRAHR